MQVDRLDITEEVIPVASNSTTTRSFEFPLEIFIIAEQIRNGMQVFSSAMDTTKVAIAKKNAVPPKR